MKEYTDTEFKRVIDELKAEVEEMLRPKAKPEPIPERVSWVRRVLVMF